MISFPVPLSPEMRMVLSVSMTLSSVVNISQHQRRLADDVLKAEPLAHLLPERIQLLFQVELLDDVLEDDQEFVVVEGFDQVIVGAELHGGDRGLHVVRRGDDHDHDPRLLLAYLPEDLDAIHAGKLEVQHQDVMTPLAQPVEDPVPAVHGVDIERAAQEVPEELPHPLFVVRDQYFIFTVHYHTPRTKPALSPSPARSKSQPFFLARQKTSKSSVPRSKCLLPENGR